jgi:hypothetical protein
MNLGGFQDLFYEAINEDVTFQKDVNSFMKKNPKVSSYNQQSRTWQH